MVPIHPGIEKTTNFGYHDLVIVLNHAVWPQKKVRLRCGKLGATAVLLFLLVLLVILAACAQPVASQPTNSPTQISPPVTSTAAPSATAVPTLTPQPGSSPPAQDAPANPLAPTLPPAPEPRSKYRLEASLDYAAHTLSVEEEITYTNTSPDRLDGLALVVEARRYPGVFQLGKITKPDGERIFHFLWKDTSLSVPLEPALEPGQVAQIHLSYTLQLFEVAKQAQIRPYPLGYTSLQANFGDWYPFIPPYQTGTGWLAHPSVSLWRAPGL